LLSVRSQIKSELSTIGDSHAKTTCQTDVMMPPALIMAQKPQNSLF